MTAESKQLLLRHLTIGLCLLIVVCSSIGCRRTLCSDGPSQLWPKYLQRQGDLAWTQQGHCDPKTHLAKATSDFQAGFGQGFYDVAYDRVQPAGPGIYQPSPIPTRLAKRISNHPTTDFGQGYVVGSSIASSNHIGGFTPGDDPLPGVSRVPIKR